MQALNEEDQESAKKDPAKWRRNFVRAMNCIANKAATAKAVQDNSTYSAAGDCERPGSSVSKMAFARPKAEDHLRFDTKAESVAASKAEEMDWDASTCVEGEGHRCVGHGGNQKSHRGAAEDLLRESPILRHMHSAQSLKVLMDQSAKPKPCDVDTVVPVEHMLLVV